MKTALLLSGGIESTIIAYEYKPDIAVTINYGQPSASSEIKASKYICSKLGIEHIILEIDILKYLKTQFDEWIPYRNQYLLTTAAIRLNEYQISELFIGTIHSDNIHPDGTLEFIDKINQLFSIEKCKINITAPYINLTIDELLKTTSIPLNLLAIVHSCTTSDLPCNRCNSCKKYYNFFTSYKKILKGN